MTDHTNSEITILGCGLSGMITALALANAGLKTTIIESKSTKDKTFFTDPRTTAITAASKRLFEKIDIWHEIEKISGPIKDIYVVDNKSPEMIHFDSDLIEGGADSYMGYLVLNKELKETLFQITKKNNNINILDEISYTKIKNSDSGCIIDLLGGGTINSKLVIVCDGRNSAAKSKFFSAKIIKDYEQKAITFIVHHEKSHENTAVEHFMPSGPFAILPLRDLNKSSIVWTTPSDKADVIVNLPKNEIEYLAQENFGQFLGQITIEGEIKAFPLTAYLTKNYVNKRMVLLADTAHVIHPLAGQGLNQGIKDIKKLVEIISSSGINNQSLMEYQRARSPDNHNMLEITDTLNAVFSNNSTLAKVVRQVGFATIDKVTPFRKALIKYAMGRRSEK